MTPEVEVVQFDGQVLTPSVVFPNTARVVGVEVYFDSDNKRLKCLVTYMVQVRMSWQQLTQFYRKRYAKHIVQHRSWGAQGERREFFVAAESASRSKRELLIVLEERPRPALRQFYKGMNANLPLISVTVEAPNFAQQVQRKARNLGEYSPYLHIPLPTNQ